MISHYTNRCYIILFFTFLINFTLFAQEGNQLQQKKIDSLTTILQKKSSTDTITLYRIKELLGLLVRDLQFDLATNYAQKAIKISKELKKKQIFTISWELFMRTKESIPRLWKTIALA